MTSLENRLQVVYFSNWWRERATRAAYEMGFASVMESMAQGSQNLSEGGELIACFQRGRDEALKALNNNGKTKETNTSTWGAGAEHASAFQDLRS